MDYNITNNFDDTSFFNPNSVSRGANPDCTGMEDGEYYDWLESGAGCICKKFWCNDGLYSHVTVAYYEDNKCGDPELDPDCPKGGGTGGGGEGPTVNNGDPNWWYVLIHRLRWYWYVNNIPSDPNYVFVGNGAGDAGPGDYNVSNRGDKGFIPGEQILNGKMTSWAR
jgi:hypothetical protein